MNNCAFDLDLIRRYDVPGPRYTSYPTALQFGEFDQSQFEQAIQQSPHRHHDLSIYVHLPFCATLCYYCACNKVVTRRREPLQQYLEDLAREVQLAAPAFSGRQVSQLHWGGGTPTFLDDEQIDWLSRLLRSAFRFRADQEGEFSVEIDPRTVDPARIQRLRQAGFNRLSFGIQDFDPDVQAAVNRRQSFEQTRKIMNAARESGFSSVSVDLIYGLPFQSVDSYTRTLEQVVLLGPDRISVYNYAHLPERFPSQRRILASDLPSPETRLKILERCIEFLTESGYVYIGMDHFARPGDELAIALQEGTLQRNFQGYSTHADTDLLALGITGISHIGNTYSQNEKDLEQYHLRLSASELPILQGVAIDEDDLLRKEVIRQLMCHFRISFQDLDRQFHISFKHYFNDELHQMQQMIEDGLVTVDENELVVTDTGRFLIRNICMVFDRYIQSVPVNRYSRAI